jgi:hypothetical protein
MKRNENHSGDTCSTYDFNEENKSGLLEMIENLPCQKYEMELFETSDKTGIIICFEDDLFIKINFEDRSSFEEWFGFKIGDHVNIDFGERNENIKNSKI